MITKQIRRESHTSFLSIKRTSFPLQALHTLGYEMGRARTRLPSLCASRAMARVRVRSWTPWSKPTSNSIQRGWKNEFSGNGMGKSFSSNVEMGWCGGGNRIMVVVDSSIEAKGALEWALSHAVQPQDTLLLFHVTKSTRSGQICIWFFLFFFMLSVLN